MFYAEGVFSWMTAKPSDRRLAAAAASLFAAEISLHWPLKQLPDEPVDPSVEGFDIHLHEPGS